ncbi:hypothetical protein [Kineococcus indalonis]|uniref:hypothetical protein n=1 Tax=Kineococcus indalonis TaxID=2696566 RepID=UPI0014132EEF|nr:hypothetical protein [Kineococcus indalonis]NAZ87167.1 hypothetical protein [Kineococcus indalonis]
MLNALVAAVSAETTEMTEEAHGWEGHLPMAPIAFAIVAGCILLAMLLVTWAFRSVGNRH